MIRFIFSGIMFVHGLIHVMGFLKAFGYKNIPAFSSPVSKTAGIACLFTAILFVPADLLLMLSVSQGLVTRDWHDARFGTIIKILVAVALLLLIFNYR